MVMRGGEIGRAYFALATDLSAFSAGLARARTEAEAATAGIGRTVDQVGAAMQAVGARAVGVLSIASAALAAAGVKSFADFQTSLTRIQSLVGVSTSQLAGFRDAILQLSPAVGRGPKELSDALYYITSDGLRGARALNVLELSAKGAAAGLGTTKDVANAITSATANYSASGLTAAHAADVLVAAIREGRVPTEELAVNIGKLLPVAAAAGISFDEAAAGVASLTRAGLSASQATTYYRQLIDSFLYQTPRGLAALKSVGLSFTELRRVLDQEGPLAALQLLQDRFHGNLEEIHNVVPRIQGLTAMLGLVGQNAQNVAGVFRNIIGTTGDLNNAFDIASQTLGFKFNQAMARIQISLIRLGDLLAPLAEQLFRGLADGVQSVGNVLAAFKRQLGDIAGPLASIGLTGPVVRDAFFAVALGLTAATVASIAFWAVNSHFLAIAVAIGAVALAASYIVRNFDMLKAHADLLGPAILGVGAAVLALAASLAVLNVAFPPLLVVSGIVLALAGGAILLAANVNSLRQALQYLATGLVGLGAAFLAAAAAAEILDIAFPPLLIVEGILLATAGLALVVALNWKQLNDAWANTPPIIQDLINIINPFIRIAAGIDSVIEGFKAISGAIGVVVDVVHGRWASAWDGLQEVARHGVRALLDTVVAMFGTLPNILISIAEQAVRAMFSAINEAWAANSNFDILGKNIKLPGLGLPTDVNLPRIPVPGVNLNELVGAVGGAGGAAGGLKGILADLQKAMMPQDFQTLLDNLNSQARANGDVASSADDAANATKNIASVFDTVTSALDRAKQELFGGPTREQADLSLGIARAKLAELEQAGPYNEKINALQTQIDRPNISPAAKARLEKQLQLEQAHLRYLQDQNKQDVAELQGRLDVSKANTDVNKAKVDAANKNLLTDGTQSQLADDLAEKTKNTTLGLGNLANKLNANILPSFDTLDATLYAFNSFLKGQGLPFQEGPFKVGEIPRVEEANKTFAEMLQNVLKPPADAMDTAAQQHKEAAGLLKDAARDLSAQAHAGAGPMAAEITATNAGETSLTAAGFAGAGPHYSIQPPKVGDAGLKSPALAGAGSRGLIGGELGVRAPAPISGELTQKLAGLILEEVQWLNKNNAGLSGDPRRWAQGEISAEVDGLRAFIAGQAVASEWFDTPLAEYVTKLGRGGLGSLPGLESAAASMVSAWEASLPRMHTGSWNIPASGPAYVHKGEMVLSPEAAAAARSLMGSPAMRGAQTGQTTMKPERTFVNYGTVTYDYRSDDHQLDSDLLLLRA